MQDSLILLQRIDVCIKKCGSRVERKDVLLMVRLSQDETRIICGSDGLSETEEKHVKKLRAISIKYSQIEVDRKLMKQCEVLQNV